MSTVRAQWSGIIEGVASQGPTTSNVLAAVHQAGRLASQLKAIKQELLPQMRLMTCPGDVVEESFDQYCSRVAADGVMADSNHSSSDAAQEESTRVNRLAACVWVWTVCLATVLNDMELLSTSLSFIASCRSLKDFAEAMLLSESYAFFYGNAADDGSCLSDGDVLLACELLYHLFTRDDAAAEVAFRRVVFLIDACEESIDGSLCRWRFLTTVVRMAECVAVEDYGALKRLMKLDSHADIEPSGLLPPLIILFTQVMLDSVVHRQLVDGCFQNVWRPLISVEMPASTGAPAAKITSALSLSPSAAGTLISSDLSAASSRWVTCRVLQRESLPPRCSWPLPAALLGCLFP